ncbi:hypothetical protein V6N13_143320 [Hibiscus sabdariffa]|uniref:Uncharacterized protein n=1 Tax=Hibiscus sabdariffa TaxID=183260 RepID=A0ABR2FGX6_9ROSI
MQVAGVDNVNNSFNATSALPSAGTIVQVQQQNSMNLGQQNSMNYASSPYVGHPVQISSPPSSSMLLQAQANPSPFQSSAPSSNNNPPQAPHGASAASSHTSSAHSHVNMSMQASFMK